MASNAPKTPVSVSVYDADSVRRTFTWESREGAPPDGKDKKHAVHTFLDKRAADTGRSRAPLSSNSGPQRNRSRPISHTSQ